MDQNVKPGYLTTEFWSHAAFSTLASVTAIAGFVLAHQTLLDVSGHFIPGDVSRYIPLAISAASTYMFWQSHVHYTNTRAGVKGIDFVATIQDLIEAGDAGAKAKETADQQKAIEAASKLAAEVKNA